MSTIGIFGSCPLNLDETLIHGSEKELEQPADFQVGQFLIYERPYVREFMNFCREHFIVAVWTTATPNYAESILHKVCGHDYPFEFIWCRDRCTPRGEGYDGEFRWIKDLKRLMPFLLELKGIENIRKIEKRGWVS